MTHGVAVAGSVRRWAALAVAVMSSAGCVRQVSGTVLIPAAEPAAVASTRLADTVWYISTRAREDGRDTRRFADSLEYGLAIHTYRRAADVMVDGLDLAVSDSVLLTKDAFVRGVREATSRDPRDDFAILFVHGFGTSQRECLRYASESRIRARSGVPWVAFCWPSNGAGIAPPTRGAILDRAYRSDSAVALESQPALVRSAQVMLEALPASQIMLVSHSLGAQLLAGALSDTSSLREQLIREPTRAIVFAAPDLARSRFADSVVTSLQPLTERLVVYTSGRDRMLAISRGRSGMARAGQRDLGASGRADLESIDATDGLAAENRFAQIFGTHHALRRASAILFDMIFVVGARRAPDCRATIGTAVHREQGEWALSALRPDADSIAARCASGAQNLR